MRIQICLHWNFFDRTNHVQNSNGTTLAQEEEEQQQRSSFIELAKKICEFKNVSSGHFAYGNRGGGHDAYEPP